MLAEVALDGDVDAEALGEGGAGLDDVAFAEFGPFGAAEGAFDDEVVEEVEFPVGEDGPAAGLAVPVEEVGERHWDVCWGAVAGMALVMSVVGGRVGGGWRLEWSGEMQTNTGRREARREQEGTSSIFIPRREGEEGGGHV